MTELFLRVFNLSVSAGWFVLAVLVLRLLLRKAPKWTAPALWGLVGLRLLLPFSIESPFSLLPSGETVSPEIMMVPRPAIDSGVPIIDQAVNPAIAGSFAPNPGDSANPLQIWLFLAAAVWLTGAAVMLLYALVSYLRLKKRVETAVRLRDNIFQSENVPSPFVLGVVRPRIYLPFSMGKEDMTHVIAHEEAHIARLDHWWKPLGFLLLSAYWFNPLLWTAYILLCRDIELACDERVIKSLEPGPRADYSQALLNCGVKRRTVAACPLAFGEVGVKERVKRVLNYKKPAFWLTVAAVVVCAAAAVCFLTDPARYDEKIQVGGQVYVWDGSTVEELPAGSQTLGTLQSIAHRTKEPPEGDFSAVNLDAKYAGNALFRSGADPDTVFLEDLKGFYLAFLRETAGDVVWRDEDYGEDFPYELRLPESWRGNFDTIAALSRDAERKISGYSVEFHQQKRSAPDLDGLVFTLTVRPDEGQNVEEIAASMPPVPSAYLGRGGGWIYYVYFASDVRVDPANRSVAREYQTMRSDAEAQLGPDNFTYLGEDTQAYWSFEGTVFRYGGKEFDLTEREGLINSIESCTPAGRYLVLEGHVGPHNGVYCIFDTDAEEFVKDIIGHPLIWEGDDLTTAVYAFWNDIYYYDGRLAKKLSLAEDEYIQSLEFTDSSYKVQVNIRGSGEWERAEYVTLSRFPNADSAGDGSAGELTMDRLREIHKTGTVLTTNFDAYSNGVLDEDDSSLNYIVEFDLEDQGKSYRLVVSRMRADNSLDYVELQKRGNGEAFRLYWEGHDADVDLDGFLAHDYDIRDKVSWTTPAGLTETEYRADCGIAGGVLLKPDAYEVLGDPGKRSCPPEWTAAGMVSEYYTDVVEWNGAEIGMVHGFYNHSDPEPLGPVDGLCAPAYLVKSNHDLYTMNDLAQLEEQGVDTESLETTSDYWYVWFARPGEEKGVVISLNAKNFTQEDILEFAKSVRY